MDEFTRKIYNSIDMFIQEHCMDGEIVVFGAGKQTEEFLKYSMLKINSEIYDNDTKKTGSTLCEEKYLIKLGSMIEQSVAKDKWILIVSNFDREIYEMLQQMGYNNLLSFRMIKKYVEAEFNVAEGKIEACMIEATNYCNARCKFCINPKMKRTKMHMSRMTFDTIIKRLIDEKLEPKIFNLHCSGEPLLDPDLFYKLEKLKKIFPDSDVGFTTNFSMATDEIIENIFRVKQDHIVISLNAIEEREYYSIMGLDYNNTVNNVNKFLKRKEELNSDIKVTLSVVVDENNKYILDEFKETWRGKDVFLRIMPKGDWLDTDEENEFENSDKGIPAVFCSYLHKEICILSDGRYALCCFDAEGSLKDADVYNCGIIEGIQKKENWRKSFVLGEGLFNECRNCSFGIKL